MLLLSIVLNLSIENAGHWLQGAGLTTGEEQEQSNAKMSRYRNSTNHMGTASKINLLVCKQSNIMQNVHNCFKFVRSR